MVHDLIVILLILIVSWINNLFIPLLLFHRQYGLWKKKYKGGGGCNGWSFVMDGILVGMMNVTVVIYLLSIKYNFSAKEAVWAFSISLIITALTHIVMSIRKWNIWIMPKPWRWNTAGYWHMISMTLQIWLFALVLMIVYNNHIFLGNIKSVIMVIIFFFWALLFMWAFVQKDRGLKIGRFHINKESW